MPSFTGRELQVQTFDSGITPIAPGGTAIFDIDVSESEGWSLAFENLGANAVDSARYDEAPQAAVYVYGPNAPVQAALTAALPIAAPNATISIQTPQNLVSKARLEVGSTLGTSVRCVLRGVRL